MTLPANIRVNAQTPFPATVKANGPVTLTKQNGIWTVGLQIANLGVAASGTDPTQLYLLVYNNLTKSFQRTTVAAVATSNPTPTVVTNAMSPYAPLPTDFVLLVDVTGGAVEIDVPLSTARNSASLIIKHYKGNAVANNITIKPSGAETIDSYTNGAPLVLNTNFDGVNLRPITAQYVIEP